MTLMVLSAFSAIGPGGPHLDSGGAFSTDSGAVCRRLQLTHEPSQHRRAKAIRTSWKPLRRQRRLYDYEVSLTTTPFQLEQRH